MCVVLLPPELPAKFQRVLIAKSAEKLQQQKMLKKNSNLPKVTVNWSKLTPEASNFIV